MTTVTRPEKPENRVTIDNVAAWWDIRARHDELAGDSKHHVLHINKAVGLVAGMLEHRDHGEPEDNAPEVKRYADLIIHAIRLAECEGHDAATIVSNRMWELGIAPIRSELPATERSGPQCTYCVRPIETGKVSLGVGDMNFCDSDCYEAWCRHRA